MAVYGSMVLTQQGLALYSKAQTGIQLNFTRMQIGSGQLAPGQDPTTLTALITPVSFFPINSMSSKGNAAYVRGIFENSGISSATYSCELGLFAQDPTLGEILYAYANAGNQGDTIPPISAGPYSKQFQINAAIGNATSVTATIPADTYIPSSQKGAANGVAQLDGSSLVAPVNLPKATGSALGAVKVGSGINLAGDGTISIAAADWSTINGKPTSFTPSAHAVTHKTGGSDALTPTDIGAETPAGSQAKVDAKVGDLSLLMTTAKANTVAAVNELFQSASSGKSSVAAAITGMGQAAAGSDTYAQLAAKIGNISKDANAGAVDVLTGKTFYQGGSKQTGTMPNRGAPTWTPGAGDQALSAGYYPGGTVLGDTDLIAGNIRSGINIFGVIGNVIEGKRWASGTATTVSDAGNGFTGFSVSGLSFTPSLAVAWLNSSPQGSYSDQYCIYSSAVDLNGNSGFSWYRYLSTWDHTQGPNAAVFSAGSFIGNLFSAGLVIKYFIFE